MSWMASAINTGWMLSSRSELRKFQVATHEVQNTQQQLLKHMIEANSNTDFGRQFGFQNVKCYKDFADRVPIANYDLFRPLIDRIGGGQPNVLTCEPVLLLEPTSGSTEGRKLIPYTKTLRIQMQRSISAWIANLFEKRPGIRSGTAYWSISPAVGPPEVTAGGIQIGFADDTEYLSRMERWAVRHVMAVSPTVSKLSPVATFRRQTLVELLLASDLALISIWSPTFLAVLIDELFSDVDRIIDATIKINRRRGRFVASILNTNASRGEKLAEIWPSLTLISCWADGSASTFLGQVKKQFSNVEIQPKGLLSTEAFLSFPLIDDVGVQRLGSALAIRSHFFEFTLADHEGDEVVLAHELNEGGRYIPVVTTGGGLYRYRTEDMIEVVGFENECPMFRFVGRMGRFTDLVGEKIDEDFVQAALSDASTAGEFGFAMLVPVSVPVPHYRLYLDPLEPSAIAEDRFRSRFLSYLSRNPHYKYACELGQLDPTEVLISRGNQFYYRLFEQACIKVGIKAGDIKSTVLCSNPAIATAIERLHRLFSPSALCSNEAGPELEMRKTKYSAKQDD